MKCPDCGNPVEKEAQFCPKCYARIEPPTFWQKLVGFFQGPATPRRPLITIKRTVSIKTDKDGQHHEYHSLDEVPSELRKEIEELETKGLKEGLRSSSSDGLRTNVTTKFISEKTVSLYKVRDAAGNEHAYHSLEEMPAEIRTALERAKKAAGE
jgi:hypothetical protein